MVPRRSRFTVRKRGKRAGSHQQKELIMRVREAANSTRTDLRTDSLHQGQGKQIKTLVGTVKRHPDGFGFFIPMDASHPDVYLSRRQMEGVMSGDQIRIAVTRRRGRKDLLSGEVLQITQRFFQSIIGQYQPISETEGMIKDDSIQWGEDLKVKLGGGQKIRSGEWVQAHITHWPATRKGFSGRIVSTLGFFSSGLEDNVRVMQKNNIPVTFPAACIKEADQWPEHLSKTALRERKDLRSFAFVTIDGETAEDFDDAIYVTNNTLYIAIADVSYYVPLGSVLDQCARQRGNSTYFPKFVVPMLPDRLSSHLCSLKPCVDRLVFVAEIHFNPLGEKQKVMFYPAVIRSQARFNYGQAQDIIDQATSPVNNPPAMNVYLAGQLARKLLNLRLKNHFVNLDIPETEVRLNQLGEPVDIIQSKRLFSHQVIEELMLSANQSVAEFLHRKKIQSLYRVHDLPKKESLKFLESFVQGLGIKITLSPPHLHKKLSEIIQYFSRHSLSAILQILVLRSLSQALYSAQRKDHFGLNFKYYTHFTSPIRRYSDLVVHRILKAALMGQTIPYSAADLESIAIFTSACEQRSVKSERQVKDIKKARFLKKYLGEHMDGVICSVVKFGFFVRLRLYDIEGLVHLDRLPGQWQFEESLLQLISKGSRRRFQIGDFVRVQVISSNIETGQIDFELKKHQKTRPKKTQGR